MFEFHGWAVLQASAGEPDEAAQVKLVQRFRVRLARSECYRFVSFADTLNGLDCFAIHGLRNHRRKEVFDLFRWVASNGPGSYGLLTVWNFEDNREEGGAHFSGLFRVWRLARGQFTEHADPFLSPRMPTVKEHYDPAVEQEHHAVFGRPIT